MVLAAEIALLIPLVASCVLLWRFSQRLDARSDALYKMHKALAKDAQRTQLTAESMLAESLSLHESNKSVLNDPRIQRILNRER